MDWLAVGAIVVVMSGGALRYGRGKLGGKGRRPSDTEIALTVAANVAVERHHPEFRVAHLALALLCDPNVEARAASHGLELSKVLAAVDAHLVALPATATPTVPAAAAEVTELLQTYRTREGTILSPVQLVTAILAWRGDPALADVLDAAGFTRERWAPGQAGQDAKPDEPVVSAHGPYRAAPVTPRGDTEVVLWNDATTPMQTVTSILNDVFAIFAPTSTRLMLEVHYRGFAVVGTYPRAEAEDLVSRTILVARGGGWPLRITAAPRGQTDRMSGLEQWVRARTALLEPRRR